jgi:hypothetical protein
VSGEVFYLKRILIAGLSRPLHTKLRLNPALRSHAPREAFAYEFASGAVFFASSDSPNATPRKVNASERTTSGSRSSVLANFNQANMACQLTFLSFYRLTEKNL